MAEKSHAKAAALFNEDEQRVDWHNETLWMVRSKRDRMARQLPEWEALRSEASAIKEHTLSHLDEYLVAFEQNALRNGVQVHWASDAREHNEIVLGILRKHGARRIVKSKSMLTEECGLNTFLHDHGLSTVDTDLGEFIVQLREELPSHIVLPAIHLKREDVSHTFEKHLHTEPGNSDPTYLAREARAHLRKRFMEAEVAITGVNFAVAENGGMVVCTNEGNADMGVHAARVHIASMGIEKVIPRAADLGVFLRLLARSATGQPITTYSSHFLRPREGQEMHVILVDNGRSRQLAKPAFRNSLKCIRCGACFNTCPVYRFSGGHSYHSAVAGPIGSILAPNFDMKKNADLPFASSLCGSCSNVCPVKINIHEQLWHWRQVLMQEGQGSLGKKLSMKVMGVVLASPFLYKWSGALARTVLRYAPGVVKSKKLNPWYQSREMPVAPRQSFQEWYRKKKHNEQ